MTAMVRAGGLRGYTALMRELGADPIAMLRRYRIAPESLEDDDALLSLRAVVHLIEASSVATRCPDFGLRMAHNQDISVLGPLAIAMQNAPTVGHAMAYAARYLFVHSPGLVITLHEDSPLARKSAELRFEIRLAGHPAQRQTVDLCLGDIHHMVKLLAGDRYILHAVTLPHEPVAPRSAYRRFFGAPVHFAQAYAGLHIAHATLEIGLQKVNQTLRQIAVDYLSVHFREPGQTLSSRVRQTLRRTLGTTRGKKAGIAELLGMHPRTLQRRLDAERTTFEAIREEVLKEAALHYLRETRISLTQLAGVLGLSEQSALARSCRRWFGVAPSELRRQAVAASARGGS
jgi:AraC-like DNA-binding protein